MTHTGLVIFLFAETFAPVHTGPHIRVSLVRVGGYSTVNTLGYSVDVAHPDKQFSDLSQTEPVVSNRHSHSLTSVQDLSAHSVRHVAC